MRLDVFLQKSSNLHAENRLLRFVVLIIGITVLANTYMTYRALNSHRTIIVPPVIGSQIEFSGDKASDEYIREFTRYFCALALTYTPATARKQFDELLLLYAPEVFPDAKKLFYALADDIELAGVSNSFVIQSISIDNSKKEIKVTGQNLRYKDDKRIEDMETRKYVINYRVQNGRFMLLRFNILPGSPLS